MRDKKLPTHSKCFVDTNVWLYSFIKSQHEEKSTLSKAIIKKNEIVVSTQIINEMCVNLIKKAKFSEDKIEALIKSLYVKYPVLELTQEILLQASQIRNDFQFSFWDSLVAASALDCEAEYLISEDMQNDFNLWDKIKIINPFK